MYNKDAVEFILKNKKNIIKKHSFLFKNEQIAEDCMQVLLTRLMTKEYGIENIPGFVKTGMQQIFLNYKRTNRRYYLESSLGDMVSKQNGNDYEPVIFESHVSENTAIRDIELKQVWGMINDEIEKLPKNQRDAIMRRLNEVNAFTNTEKANYRHGMLKIKEKLQKVVGDSFNRETYGF